MDNQTQTLVDSIAPPEADLNEVSSMKVPATVFQDEPRQKRQLLRFATVTGLEQCCF
jgi:hypothetical protein